MPDGTRYVAKDTLLARRTPQVKIGKDATYGMGLMVDTKYGTPVVHHGGDLIGYHSDMMWLPEHKVGAVILTNADPGWILRTAFRRKLLEVLFDGRPEADADVAALAKTFSISSPPTASCSRSRRSRPMPRSWRRTTSTTRSATSRSPRRPEDRVRLRRVAQRGGDPAQSGRLRLVHHDRPGISGFEFVVGSGAKPSLIVRDAQHEYVFAADGSVTSSK